MINRWAAALISACTIIGSTGVWVENASAASPPPVPAASRVMVMPFETTAREPRSYWLGEGSAVILSDSLLALGLPVMRRDERRHSFELLRVPVVAGLSHATVIRVGQTVGASQVIVGMFSLAGDTLTVRARPILLDSGLSGPEISETGPLDDIFEIYDRVALRLVPGSSSTTVQLENSHPPIAAFEQFIKGLLAEMPKTKLSFLNEALRLAPGLQRARIAAWDVYHDLGQHDRALAAVKQVPADHRLSRQARFLGSVSLLELKRYQEAFDELTKLNKEQADATLLNNLGVVQLRRGATPHGAYYFKKAVDADPDDADYVFNLGYAYWQDRDPQATIYWLREAVRRNPADHAAHFVLGVSLAALGSQTEAGREKDLARQLSSVYAEWEAKSPSGVPRGLERLRMDLGLPDVLRVENVIGAAGQRDQRQLASFHLDVARRAFEGERDAEAISELQRAIYLAPYDHDAHLLLGRIYLRGGRLQDAIDALKISIWSSDTVQARYVLAEAYEKAGMVSEARAELEKLVKRDPADQEARRRLDHLTAR